jgi:hypothetical protein
MTPEEIKSLQARRKALVDMKEEAVGRANQASGGIAVIDALLATDRVEIATFMRPQAVPSEESRTGTDG